MGMREEIFYDSCGSGKIHASIWPVEKPIAVVQILHGIAEHVFRYDAFANFLNSHEIAVVADDHMGHGESAKHGATLGYFTGGWSCAVEDSRTLMGYAKSRFGAVPYILFGHSMGSFMVRTWLIDHPEDEVAGCVICGTGWQPKALLSVAIPLCNVVCKSKGEKNPSEFLQKLMFGSYNQKVEHVRTSCDWLTRENAIVDAYVEDPLCGFVPASGLCRDMLSGIRYIQISGNLQKMKKDLPVLFVAGGDDPVGAYGKGVLQTVEAFRKAGMESVSHKIYPLCRHEILNEINREEIYHDLLDWTCDRV